MSDTFHEGDAVLVVQSYYGDPSRTS